MEKKLQKILEYLQANPVEGYDSPDEWHSDPKTVSFKCAYYRRGAEGILLVSITRPLLLDRDAEHIIGMLGNWNRKQNVTVSNEGLIHG